MAMDGLSPDSWADTLSDINTGFTVIFTTEMAFKLYGLGPRKYVGDFFNIFDAFVVMISLVEVVINAMNSSDQSSGGKVKQHGLCIQSSQNIQNLQSSQSHQTAQVSPLHEGHHRGRQEHPGAVRLHRCADVPLRLHLHSAGHADLRRELHLQEGLRVREVQL
jgi:hypothetical protein